MHFALSLGGSAKCVLGQEEIPPYTDIGCVPEARDTIVPVEARISASDLVGDNCGPGNLDKSYNARTDLNC